MTDPTDGGDDRDDNDDHDRNFDTGLWGPWLLALGAVVIGVVAVGIEVVRVLRERVRCSDDARTARE